MSQTALIGDKKTATRSPSPASSSYAPFQPTTMTFPPEMHEQLQVPKPKPKPKPVRTLGNPTPL